MMLARTSRGKRILGLVGSLMLASMFAQTASDLNNGLRVSHNAGTDIWTVSWWGHSGYTYFLQHSLDLVTWNNLNRIETGQNQVIDYEMTSSAGTNFWRISSIDVVAANPGEADFDGDGLSNQLELTIGTDPLKADTDGDSVPDGVEYHLGLELRKQAESDASNQLDLKVHAPR